MVGRMVRGSAMACAIVAAASIASGVATGHTATGIGLGTGLLIGSTNGVLIAQTLQRNMPFTLASIGRLLLLSGLAVGLALLLGPQAWALMIGVAAAQVLMVAVAVRQGLRA